MKLSLLPFAAFAQAALAFAPLPPPHQPPPPDCQIQGWRYPARTLSVTYVFQLTGPCIHGLNLQFSSSLGGYYPTPPIHLSNKNRLYVYPEAPQWWFPVLLTSKGPINIYVKDGR